MDQQAIRGTIGTLAPLTVALLAMVIVFAAVRHRGEPPPGKHTAAAVVAGAAGLVFLLGASYVLPWYSTWTLPLLALAWRSRVSVVATVQATVLALAYTAPLVTGGLFAVYAQDVVPIVSVVALAYLVASARRRRLTEPVGVAPAPAEGARPDQLLARW